MKTICNNCRFAQWGSRYLDITDEWQTPGKCGYPRSEIGLPAGVYIVRLSFGYDDNFEKCERFEAEPADPSLVKEAGR